MALIQDNQATLILNLALKRVKHNFSEDTSIEIEKFT